jgi:hypothetical protein
MGSATHWPRRAEWLDDARREPRWCDVRTALAKIGDEEYLGKVRDLSLGGLGLAVGGVRARPGQRVQVFVVFERRVLEVGGKVAYARPERWGSFLGVECGPLAEDALRFLSERYSEPSARGSVK